MLYVFAYLVSILVSYIITMRLYLHKYGILPYEVEPKLHQLIARKNELLQSYSSARKNEETEYLEKEIGKLRAIDSKTDGSLLAFMVVLWPVSLVVVVFYHFFDLLKKIIYWRYEDKGATENNQDKGPYR